ncbi:class I SAM-dependent methyltransferase [Paenibacillus glucanolyticus]|jgi:ubiquinone/menaquinone biosynthesis C-methylase UbiE|uniref:class I SAM-dependent methyltransferase n=1 Tax=Paenibacillus TaxID=44249 RepID=UPI0007B42039|nr:class I SAM-dependent methyltransferase [Paenibacillus glucanolyticus]ANA78561.1 methyltransferase type 11 [Paenibacillus glucanolyticus]AVV57522.1 class I SAM-dependent methyltransferase [Paenibacillus glucanolyticus]
MAIDDIYNKQAEAYEIMVSRQPDLSGVIHGIRSYEGLDVLDLGAGSGRLSIPLVSDVSSLICTDISQPMLDILDDKFIHLHHTRNWTTVVADHRSLPLASSSVDLVVSGWSISYLAHSNQENCSQNLEQVMAELQRVLRPGGTIIILETMGTGTDTPNPPDFLVDYYAQLERTYGFNHRWIRMDYVFDTVEEAQQCTGFFFGEELSDKIQANQWSTVPECAGVWWKHV